MLALPRDGALLRTIIAVGAVALGVVALVSALRPFRFGIGAEGSPSDGPACAGRFRGPRSTRWSSTSRPGATAVRNLRDCCWCPCRV
ncbi:hypothetical protein NKG94_45615 [Micromonospora sp. M12]